MRKFVIVSSYSESCGNAAFTKVIAEGLEKYCEVSVHVAELDLNLTQSLDSTLRQTADRHIKTLCKDLAEADMVNIQLEAGLYGTYPKDIYKRICYLVEANKNTSVTLHSPRLIHTSVSDKREAIKSILNGRLLFGVKKLFGNYYSSVHINLNRKLIKYFINKKLPLIVHTMRAKYQIEKLYGYKKVFVHPLKFVESDFFPKQDLIIEAWRDVGISQSDIVIGMFGYISSYKGHLEALKSISLLPDNYKLVIYGRQHPQTLKSNGEVDSYLSKLLSFIDKNKLKNKVFFMGELDDNSFISAASSVDLCWLPYFENGQDGSGIASICFDVSPRILCSTSFAFDELLKLIPYEKVKRFDIGNYHEMATKTLHFLEDKNLKLSPNNNYTVKSQSELYLKVLSGFEFYE